MAQYRRGDVVSCAEGDLHLVWSETLGIVHCLPDQGTWRDEPIEAIVSAPSEEDEVVTFHAGIRRHFRVDDVVRHGTIDDEVVLTFEHAMIEQRRRELQREARERIAETASRTRRRHAAGVQSVQFASA